MNTEWTRRGFVKAMAWSGAAVGAGLPALGAGEGERVRLGFDNFAVRAMNLGAEQLIEYGVQLKVDALFITDLKPFRSFEEGYLKEVRQRAADAGLQIYLGSWSICPTSVTFKKDWGTAEEHLALGIRMARALGSPVFRCVLGSREDRKTAGGIAARMRDTVEVLKACRTRALDAGVKVAVENHAGDMQSGELVELVESAGKDYVGVNLDAGNAAWTLEDPVDHLEVLGRYVVCTSLRDSMVWETKEGARVAWTAMGEGNVDLKAYFKRFRELCPGVPVNIETISGFSVEFPYLRRDFWDVWPKASARSFARFVALAKTGRELPGHRSANAEEEQAYQKGELERSLRYCRETLGLGLG